MSSLPLLFLHTSFLLPPIQPLSPIHQTLSLALMFSPLILVHHAGEKRLFYVSISAGFSSSSSVSLLFFPFNFSLPDTFFLPHMPLKRFPTCSNRFAKTFPASHLFYPSILFVLLLCSFWCLYILKQTSEMKKQTIYHLDKKCLVFYFFVPAVASLCAEQVASAFHRGSTASTNCCRCEKSPQVIWARADGAAQTDNSPFAWISWHPINTPHCVGCQTPGWLIVAPLGAPPLRDQRRNDSGDALMNNACLNQPIPACASARDKEMDR